MELEPFEGLTPAQLRQPLTDADRAAAWADLAAQRFIGFDTESKPTFSKGEVSGGPDVVQFATPGASYVFQLRHAGSEDFVRQVLAAPKLVKAGFGLGQDQQQLRHRLGVIAAPLLDLDVVFRRQGHVHTIGIKAAVALVFNRRFAKSKRITTTNWSLAQLTPQQLLYAANDAWVALRVLQALALAEQDLPVWVEGVAPPTPPRAERAPQADGEAEAAPGKPRRRRRRRAPAAG